MIALEHEVPEVAAILREESCKYKAKLRDVEYRSNYEALRRAAMAGDIVQFIDIIHKVRRRTATLYTTHYATYNTSI